MQPKVMFTCLRFCLAIYHQSQFLFPCISPLCEFPVFYASAFLFSMYITSMPIPSILCKRLKLERGNFVQPRAIRDWLDSITWVGVLRLMCPSRSGQYSILRLVATPVLTAKRAHSALKRVCCERSQVACLAGLHP